MATKATADKAVKSSATSEELVRYRLPVEKNNKGSEYFAINGKNWRIKRGVYVDIPKYLADYIDQWQEANAQAYETQERIHAEQPDLSKLD